MCALRGRGGESGQKDSWHVRLELGESDVSNTIDSVKKDFMLIEVYEDSADRQLASAEERLCEPARRESVSSQRTWDDNKKRQSVLGATDGVSRTLLATYYKIGTYNVFERGFMAVVEYEDSADTARMEQRADSE